MSNASPADILGPAFLAAVRQVAREVLREEQSPPAPAPEPSPLPVLSLPGRPTDLLSTKAVAAEANVALATVREWIRPPKRSRDGGPRPAALPARKAADGRRWLVLRADLHAFRHRASDTSIEDQAERMLAVRLAGGKPR